MEPSSRGIPAGFRDARRWSNRWKPGSASSSGIDSRMACQGGDGLEGFDVEGRVRRWREVDDAPPQSLEAEEEWDFSGADDGADALHGGLPTGALERVGAPDAEDEVAPERTDGACGDFGWWRDNRRLGCAWFFDVGFLRWRAARHPAAFV